MRGIAVALLLFLVLAASGFAQAPDDKLVVPGQRIGKWTLAMTIDDLVRLQGVPGIDLPWFDDSFYERPVFWMMWVKIKLHAYTHDRRKISALCTDDLDFGTEKQIYVYGNLDRAGLTAAHGAPTAVLNPDQYGGFFILDEIGLQVSVRQGFVWGMCVFLPKTGRSIWKF